MSTHNIYFSGEKKKKSIFFVENNLLSRALKLSSVDNYLEMCLTNVGKKCRARPNCLICV